MPERKPRVPSYRLHKSSGQAVVTIDGHDHYLGKHGSAESQAAYARLLAERAAAGSVVPRGPDISVSEVLAAYLAHARAYYVKDGESTSQLDRITRALTPVRKLYGGEPAESFGPRRLKAVRQTYVDRGHCRDQCNKLTRCVVLCWRWAAGEEMVGGPCWQSLAAVESLKKGRTTAPESPPVLPASEASIAAVLPVISLVLADVIRLQLLTAARPGEALGLRGCDLVRADEVWLWKPPSHKTQHHDKDRTLFVGPKGQSLLAPYLDRLGESYLFSPRDSMAQFRARQRVARKTRVQPSQKDRSKGSVRKQPGERYRRESYARAISLACEKLRVEHFHPHQLRHNSATRLVAQFGWEVARIILGHSDVRMSQVYAAEDTAKAVAAMREVG